MSYAPAYPSSHRRSKSTVMDLPPPSSSPFPSFAAFRRSAGEANSSSSSSSRHGSSSYPSVSQAVTTAPVVGQTRRRLRTHLKTVLANAESRRIFWFLCLNLGFMMVQLGWGVWTNSLGLISDGARPSRRSSLLPVPGLTTRSLPPTASRAAIHMFFDCLALGIGLFASVMAAWTPDKHFTYGYGRVETLSGFANGVFLLLISVFIIFEAVQRM